jgi:hypothetical protein
MSTTALIWKEVTPNYFYLHKLVSQWFAQVIFIYRWLAHRLKKQKMFFSNHTVQTYTLEHIRMHTPYKCTHTILPLWTLSKANKFSKLMKLLLTPYYRWTRRLSRWGWVMLNLQKMIFCFHIHYLTCLSGGHDSDRILLTIHTLVSTPRHVWARKSVLTGYC